MKKIFYFINALFFSLSLFSFNFNTKSINDDYAIILVVEEELYESTYSQVKNDTSKSKNKTQISSRAHSKHKIDISPVVPERLTRRDVLINLGYKKWVDKNFTIS